MPLDYRLTPLGKRLTLVALRIKRYSLGGGRCGVSSENFANREGGYSQMAITPLLPAAFPIDNPQVVGRGAFQRRLQT